MNRRATTMRSAASRIRGELGDDPFFAAVADLLDAVGFGVEIGGVYPIEAAHAVALAYLDAAAERNLT